MHADTVRAMTGSGHRLSRIVALVAMAAALGLAAPVVASATTGTARTETVSVTLTNKGAIWAPSLKTLHPTTATTFKLKVVNKTGRGHWFKIGTAKTKVIKQGNAQTFIFFFATPGKTPWLAGLGNVDGAAFHGVFHVTFPQQFK
jgi:hypothetical protein